MPRSSFRKAPHQILLIAVSAVFVSLTAVFPASAATAPPSVSATSSTRQHVALAAAPDALPDAFNTRTQFLTAHPTAGLPVACTERSIFLDAGLYFWDYRFNGKDIDPGGAGKTVPKSGTYTWSDCLIPENGFYRLNGSIFNSDLSVIIDNPEINVQLAASGQVKWGSVLHPEF